MVDSRLRVSLLLYRAAYLERSALQPKSAGITLVRGCAVGSEALASAGSGGAADPAAQPSTAVASAPASAGLNTQPLDMFQV